MSEQAGSPASLEPESWRALGRRLSNWGRWGATDERGTANLIGPEEIRAAAALVRQGRVFDLGIPLDQDGPQDGSERTNPIRFMSVLGGVEPTGGAFRFNDDYVFMPLQAGTQWDALSHVYYDSALYNNFHSNEIDATGAHRLGIETQGKGVVGRGVLLDVARYLREQWLAPRQAIGPDLLEAVAARQGVQVGRGDILLVRTGWRKKFLADRDREAFLGDEPGVNLQCCSWLHLCDVAAIASDNWALEVIPSSVPEEVFPVHMVLIRDMGMLIGEMFDLEELSDDCASDGIYEFLITAPVLKFTHAVGTPTNPLAIK